MGRGCDGAAVRHLFTIVLPGSGPRGPTLCGRVFGGSVGLAAVTDGAVAEGLFETRGFKLLDGCGFGIFGTEKNS